MLSYTMESIVTALIYLVNKPHRFTCKSASSCLSNNEFQIDKYLNNASIYD
jgi:hypothetical protein